jgi:chemotaxis protein histidine kinase CheA
MGMNVVKQRIVDDCGGEIAIKSEAGKFCEFSFVLPAVVA